MKDTLFKSIASIAAITALAFASVGCSDEPKAKETKAKETEVKENKQIKPPKPNYVFIHDLSAQEIKDCEAKAKKDPGFIYLNKAIKKIYYREIRTLLTDAVYTKEEQRKNIGNFLPDFTLQCQLLPSLTEAQTQNCINHYEGRLMSTLAMPGPFNLREKTSHFFNLLKAEQPERERLRKAYPELNQKDRDFQYNAGY